MNHNKECHNSQIISLLVMSYVSVEEAIRECLERLCINLIISFRTLIPANTKYFQNIFKRTAKQFLETFTININKKVWQNVQ